MRKTIPGFLKDQFTKVPPVVEVDLSGRTVVVIGANTGLGYEAVKHFAAMKPSRIIMGCRSVKKGENAVASMFSSCQKLIILLTALCDTFLDLKKETGYDAELWQIDLSNFASVKEFADKFEKDGGRLDILVENAGIATTKYEATTDGWEST